MSVGTLSWREIAAWRRETSTIVEPWEARLLRRLSAAYVTEGRKAEDESCPAPWWTGVTAREREIESAELKSLFRRS